MPWVPQTDFEEEVVNLQPHHDFIYGTLSEPEYSYPRPKAHVEYAVTKKKNNKQLQTEYGAKGKINEQLRTMQQIQLMAGTKPLGEHAALEDWENNDNNEQETIGMMRYCGMGVSVEQPLNEKVTISTYPVDNTIKVVRNGRRKVALFFDDNVFKLQKKVSDTSSEFESCKTTEACDDFFESQNDMSFNTSSSRSLKSCNTGEEFSDSFSSAYSSKKAPPTHANYEKLLEDTSLLSLDSSGSKSLSSSKQNSFKTADELNSWKPYYEYDEENMLSDKLHWPTLSKEDAASDTNEQNGSITNICNEVNNCNNSKKENFLYRFIKSEESETLDTTSKSTSATSSQELKTYASIAKTSKATATSSKEKKRKDKSSDLIRDFPPFYTTRKMYALKRNVK